MVHGECARRRREKEANVADEEEISNLLPHEWKQPEQ